MLDYVKELGRFRYPVGSVAYTSYTKPSIPVKGYPPLVGVRPLLLSPPRASPVLIALTLRNKLTTKQR